MTRGNAQWSTRYKGGPLHSLSSQGDGEGYRPLRSSRSKSVFVESGLATCCGVDGGVERWAKAVVVVAATDTCTNAVMIILFIEVVLC